VPVRVLGVDALQLVALAPELLPQPAPGSDRLVMFDPGAVFANATARERLALVDGADLRVQAGPRWQTFRLSGHVAAGGPPVLVMDVAAAQARFGLAGRLTRIDLRLAAGQRGDTLMRDLDLPADVQAARPGEAQQRLSTLSRAYRVNLTVLALVALFVGGFLVYSVVSLSVAQRTPSLALLGVLGLTARERRHLVLANAPCWARLAVHWACWPGPGWPGRRCACWVATWAAATSRACNPGSSWTAGWRWPAAHWAPPPRWPAAGCRPGRPSACHPRRR
jgi:putative ABC transport system permease protein